MKVKIVRDKLDRWIFDRSTLPKGLTNDQINKLCEFLRNAPTDPKIKEFTFDLPGVNISSSKKKSNNPGCKHC